MADNFASLLTDKICKRHLSLTTDFPTASYMHTPPYAKKPHTFSNLKPASTWEMWYEMSKI